MIRESAMTLPRSTSPISKPDSVSASCKNPFQTFQSDLEYNNSLREPDPSFMHMDLSCERRAAIPAPKRLKALPSLLLTLPHRYHQVILDMSFALAAKSTSYNFTDVHGTNQQLRTLPSYFPDTTCHICQLYWVSCNWQQLSQKRLLRVTRYFCFNSNAPAFAVNSRPNSSHFPQHP